MELIDSYTRARILSFLPIEVFRMLKKKINKKTKRNNFASRGIRNPNPKQTYKNKKEEQKLRRMTHRVILYKNMRYVYRYKTKRFKFNGWVNQYYYCYDCRRQGVLKKVKAKNYICRDCYFKRLKVIKNYD